MTENQFFIDKAISLFFNIQNRYGFGGMYESVMIKQFIHKFDFHNVRFGGKEFSVGMLHQRMLTTVLFCKEVDAFKKDNNSSIQYVLYAGKLGPKSQRSYYPNEMKLICQFDKKAISEVPITAQEIISFLGQPDIRNPLPKNINTLPIIEIIFNKDDGKIKEIKKGS